MKKFSQERIKRKLLILTILPVFVLSLVHPAGIYKAAELPIFTIDDEEQFQVGPGVSHSSYRLKNERYIEMVNTLEIDPRNKYIDLEVTSPKGKIVALDTVRNQAKQIDQTGHKVIAAFNGDFYNTTTKFAGVPKGLQITNGEIITAPQSSQSVLAVMEDGSFSMNEKVQMTGAIEVDEGNEEAPMLTGINRPESNSDYLYLYTSKFSSTTKTENAEVEVILNPEEEALKSNEVNVATVEAIEEASNSAIPSGKWILSASGEDAEWLLSTLSVGSEITFDIEIDQEVDDAVQAVSGGVVLLSDGEPTAKALKDQTRHPRTFISEKDGKLYVTTFDGRQPGYSDGVTLAEGAKYLAHQGMETAINLDGGGSTTYGVRLPGDTSLSVINSPSDGYERKNSNSLMIVSTAPTSKLSKLVVTPNGPVKILAGSKMTFTVKGQDKYFNGVKVNKNTLKWTSSKIGTINKSGQFTASKTAGKGSIKVSSGSVSTSVPIEVVKSVSRLLITPTPLIINPGEKQQFQVQAFDKKGNEIYVSPKQLKWKTTGKIGKITTSGQLTAVNNKANGTVTVTYGKVKATASVSIGKASVVIEDFEDLTDVAASSARANNVSLDVMSRPNPVLKGTHSARLAYDFTDTAGTSAAYVNFKDKDGKTGRLVEDRPAKLELSVYGDGKNHWLRASIVDGNGKSITLNLTEAGALDWEGWKTISVDIPKETATPIKIRQIYLVETNNSNKNEGNVYLDDLKAVYTTTN